MFFERNVTNDDGSLIIPLKCHLKSEQQDDKSTFVNRNRVSEIKENLGIFDYDALKRSLKKDSSE